MNTPATAIGALPPHAARELRRAAQWIERGDFRSADRAMADVRAVAPDHPEVLRIDAALQRNRGQAAAAVLTLERALATRPDDARILVEYGCALRDAHRHRDALAAFEQATEAGPDLAPAFQQLGLQLFMTRQSERALAPYARAAELDPRRVAVLIGWARALAATGRTAEAAARLREAIRVRPQSGAAWRDLVDLKTVPIEAGELADLASLEANPATPAQAKMLAGFALGNALERAGRHADAFAALGRANAARRAQVRWSAPGFDAMLDAIAAAFTPPPAPATDATLGHEAIFIISLPRSGSTLAERILSAHPDVTAAGELRELFGVIEDESRRRERAWPEWVADATPDDWHRLGLDYLQRARALEPEGRRFTDKGLGNWQLVGAIRAMLPGATIVACRRDPLETAWSCYKQYFPAGQPWTYAFDDIAGVFRGHDRLLAAWRERHPGAVFDFVYEGLLADPESAIRALLAHCGLEFDPACLDFHSAKHEIRTPSSAQVRAPLRPDTAVTPGYGALLDPLRNALADPG